MRARQAVGRPLGACNLSKAPGIASQVEFGTARSFYPSQTPIQELAENAPIFLRAFAEVECELWTEEKCPAKMAERMKTPEIKKMKEMAEPIENKVRSVSETQVGSDYHSVASPAKTVNPPSLSPPHELDEDTLPTIFPLSCLPSPSYFRIPLDEKEERAELKAGGETGRHGS